MAHIVVLGAGLGGMPAAYELREKRDRAHRVTMANAVDYFQFVPSNPWLAVGWRERDAITLPIRPYLEKKGIEFVAKRVTRIDATGNSLELQDGSRLEYDYLVITTGPKLAFDEVEGAGPQGQTHSICTVDHAEQTRAHGDTSALSLSSRDSCACARLILCWASARARPARAKRTMNSPKVARREGACRSS